MNTFSIKTPYDNETLSVPFTYNNYNQNLLIAGSTFLFMEC